MGELEQLYWPLGELLVATWLGVGGGRRRLNKHLYRSNILLQKVPELSPWSKNLMENKQQIKVRLTPLSLVYVTHSAGLTHEAESYTKHSAGRGPDTSYCGGAKGSGL